MGYAEVADGRPGQRPGMRGVMAGDSMAARRRLPVTVTGLMVALAIALVADMPWYLGTLTSGGQFDARSYAHNALLFVLVVVFAALIATDKRLRGSRALWVLGAVMVTVPVWLAYLWVHEIRPRRRA